MVYSTAAEAIMVSVQQTELTRCEPTPENLDALLAACDDNVEAGEHEFWGRDDDNNDWRVHVARAA